MKLTKDEKALRIKMKRLQKKKSFQAQIEKELSVHGGKMNDEQASEYMSQAFKLSKGEI